MLTIIYNDNTLSTSLHICNFKYFTAARFQVLYLGTPKLKHYMCNNWFSAGVISFTVTNLKVSNDSFLPCYSICALYKLESL